jgi:hypothetical protein
MVRRVLVCIFLMCIAGFHESYAEDEDDKNTLAVEYPDAGKPEGKLAEFFGMKKIAWLGIDFRKAKFIGMDIDFEGPEMLRLKYIPIWNYLVKKYGQQFSGAFGLESKDMPIDYEKMVDLNGGVAGLRIIPEDEKMKQLSFEQIGELVKLYSTGTGVDTGAAIVVDEFNYPKRRAVMHLVLIDMRTKKIIFSVRSVSKASGAYVGMYWFSAIRRMMKEVSRQYGGWKNKYPLKDDDLPFKGRY